MWMRFGSEENNIIRQKRYGNVRKNNRVQTIGKLLIIHVLIMLISADSKSSFSRPAPCQIFFQRHSHSLAAKSEQVYISITRNWITPQNGGISSILQLISRNFHFPPPQMMPLRNQSKTYVISILSYCLIYKGVSPITKSHNGAREFSSQLLLGDKYPCRAQQI